MKIFARYFIVALVHVKITFYCLILEKPLPCYSILNFDFQLMP